MKKRITDFLKVSIMICTLLLCSINTVLSEEGTIRVNSADLSIYVNGEAVEFIDGYPFIDNAGRIQVPVRFVAEKMGYEVEWEYGHMGNGDGVVYIRPNDISMEYEGETIYRTLSLGIGSNQMYVSDGDGPSGEGYAIIRRGFVKMDTEAMIRNDRTYIPLRYVAEILGYTVEWNDTGKTVLPNNPTAEKPSITFSDSIGEVNGKTYSVREVPGLSILPIETSRYNGISSFCYYDGYVYYIESEGGSSDYSTWLYRCKPDWTGKELLDEIICDWNNPDNYQEGERNFVIDNGILYYDTYSSDVETTAINLSTMQKFKTKRPKYTVPDNGQIYDRSYSSGYSIAIYNDMKFFRDNNERLYIMNNGNKQLLATEVYSIDGLSEGFVYCSGLSGSKAYLYRVSINGGEKEYIDSHMAAGGGVYFNW